MQNEEEELVLVNGCPVVELRGSTWSKTYESRCAICNAPVLVYGCEGRRMREPSSKLDDAPFYRLRDLCGSKGCFVVEWQRVKTFTTSASPTPVFKRI